MSTFDGGYEPIGTEFDILVVREARTFGRVPLEFSGARQGPRGRRRAPRCAC